MRFALLLVGALAVLGGCARYGYWPSQADGWRGKNLSDFTREHGAPQWSQPLNSMGEYIHVWHAVQDGELAYAGCATREDGQLACTTNRKWQRACTYTLITTPANIIRQAFLDGDCSWRE